MQPMTIEELRDAIAEAMPGPRKGDRVKLIMKCNKSVSHREAIVVSPGKIFHADKLDRNLEEQFSTHEDFSVLQVKDPNPQPGKKDTLLNTICLKLPKTGETAFIYSERFELQLDNKLFNGQPRVCFFEGAG